MLKNEWEIQRELKKKPINCNPKENLEKEKQKEAKRIEGIVIRGNFNLAKNFGNTSENLQKKPSID
jgi:hypothetical protein